MDATWHARPRGSATRAHAAPTRRDINIYLYIFFIICIAFRLSEGIINPLNTSHVINPTPSFNFLRVGLSSTELILMQVMWPIVERWINRSKDRRAWMKWTDGPPYLIKTCAFYGAL